MFSFIKKAFFYVLGSRMQVSHIYLKCLAVVIRNICDINITFCFVWIQIWENIINLSTRGKGNPCSPLYTRLQTKAWKQNHGVGDIYYFRLVLQKPHKSLNKISVKIPYRQHDNSLITIVKVLLFTLIHRHLLVVGVREYLSFSKKKIQI